jgi:hypothetical protein
MQCSLALHPPKDSKSLPLQRVLLAYNAHVLLWVLDVGSLSYGSSIESITTDLSVG